MEKEKDRFAKRVMAWFIAFMIVLLIQLMPGKLVAYGLIYIIAVFPIVWKVITGVTVKIRVNALVLLLAWMLTLVLLIGFDFHFDYDEITDILCLFIGLVALLFVCCIPKIDISSIRYGILYGALLGSCICLFGYFSNSDLLGLINFPYAGVRVQGGFDGPNECAAFTVIIQAMLIGWLNMYTIERPTKFVIFLTLLVLLSINVLTWSRSGLVAQLIIFASVFLYQLWKSIKTSKGMRLILLFVVFFVALMVTVDTIMPAYEEVRKNVSDREALNQAAWTMIIEKPIFGWGIGGFNRSDLVDNSSPHNDFFSFMISGGIFAFLSVCLLFAYIFFLAIKKKMYSEAFALMIFFSQEMTFNHLIRARVSFMFWMIVVIVLMNQRQLDEKSKTL